MSLPNAVIDAMLQAGCSAEQLAAAMKAANAEDEARRAAKREGNAERQKRFRERHPGKRYRRSESNALRDVTPPIDNTHTPDPDISPDGESQSQRDDVSAVIASWNDMAKPIDLPTCRKLTGARLKACKARLRDDGLQAIQTAIQRIPKSAFLRGETGSWGGANITFLLRPDTVTKILEGQYDDRQPRNGQQHSQDRRFDRPQADRRSSLTRACEEGLAFLGN